MKPLFFLLLTLLPVQAATIFTIDAFADTIDWTNDRLWFGDNSASDPKDRGLSPGTLRSGILASPSITGTMDFSGATIAANGVDPNNGILITSEGTGFISIAGAATYNSTVQIQGHIILAPGGPTIDSDGDLGNDANAWAADRDALQFWDGTAATWLLGVQSSDTPTDGQVPKWNTGGTITWEDDTGGAGGGWVGTATSDLDMDGFDILGIGNFAVTTLDATTLEIGSVAVTSTAAELNYSDGVTSNIQTQLDAKAAQTDVDSTQTGVHATPSTTDPLAPTWDGPMHTVWYGATGEIDLPAAAGYTGRGLMVYNTGAFTVTIDPNASEVIVRDGTAQTGGVTMTLSSGAGNFVALLSDGARWITLGYKGDLASGS